MYETLLRYVHVLLLREQREECRSDYCPTDGITSVLWLYSLSVFRVDPSFKTHQIFALPGPRAARLLLFFPVAVDLHRGSSDSGMFGLAAGEPRPGPGGCPERSGPVG